MNELVCTKHKTDLVCMVGCNAHPSNWYCPECDKEKNIAQKKIVDTLKNDVLKNTAIKKTREALKTIGFSSHDIVLIENICEDENISEVALFRQALRKWQGFTGITFPPHSVAD